MEGWTHEAVEFVDYLLVLQVDYDDRELDYLLDRKTTRLVASALEVDHE